MASETGAHPVPTSAECVAALQQVLASPLFLRSTRLRRLLSFLVDETLNGAANQLTEHYVGVAVFERKPAYDTSADNIVRVNATELRKRLEQFYAAPSEAISVRIDIPRGSYRAAFSQIDAELQRAAKFASATSTPDLTPSSASAAVLVPEVRSASISEPAAMQTSVPANAKGRPRFPLQLLLTVLLVACTAALVIQSVRLRRVERAMQPWKQNEATQEFWHNFIDTGGRTDVVLADTSFAFAQDLSNYRLTLDDYLRNGLQQLLPDQDLTSVGAPAAHTIRSMLMNRNTISLGDFLVARRIAALAPTSTSLVFHSSRDFSIEALRRDSAILIGSTRSNPWVEPFEDRLAYKLQSSPNGRQIEIQVPDHHAGERAMYTTSAEPDRTDGFCVIAFIPSISGDGKVLIIAGTDSQATEAGGDFITQEATLNLLARTLPDFGNKPFQLLLQTSRVVGGPLRTSLLSFRAD